MIRAQEAIAKSPQIGGARFTEIMDGYLYVGDEIENHELAVEAAKGSSSTARFYLSVDAWDIKTLVKKKNHAAMLTGTFSCGALSRDPFMVLRGEFQLFSEDPRTPDTDNLVYDFDMISVSPSLSKLIFRLLEILFTSMERKSLILQSPSVFATHGKLPRHSTLRSLIQTTQLLVAAYSQSVQETFAMNFFHSRAAARPS
jgi:hypothetical protein